MTTKENNSKEPELSIEELTDLQGGIEDSIEEHPDCGLGCFLGATVGTGIGTKDESTTKDSIDASYR